MPGTKFLRILPHRSCCRRALARPCRMLSCAQTAAKRDAAAPGTAEQRAARAYEAARANPLDLEAFLRRMPKGADLHYHEFGGIYAESWIREGAEDGLCVDLARHAFVAAAARIAARARCLPRRPSRTRISMTRS